jgi:hypothetical protein
LFLNLHFNLLQDCYYGFRKANIFAVSVENQISKPTAGDPEVAVDVDYWPENLIVDFGRTWNNAPFLPLPSIMNQIFLCNLYVYIVTC